MGFIRSKLQPAQAWRPMLRAGWTAAALLSLAGCGHKQADAAQDDDPNQAYVRAQAKQMEDERKRSEAHGAAWAGAKPQAAPAQAAGTTALPMGDASTPLDRYVPLTNGKQLSFLFYSLTTAQVDYDAIGRLTSPEYRTTTDQFKKQDLLAALRREVDAGVTQAKGQRYWYIDTKVSVGPYDFGQHAFPVRGFGSDRYIGFDDAAQVLRFSNPSPYQQHVVTDENQARALEGIISAANAQAIGGVAWPARVYFFAQAADIAGTQPVLLGEITHVSVRRDGRSTLFDM